MARKEDGRFCGGGGGLVWHQGFGNEHGLTCLAGMKYLPYVLLMAASSYEEIEQPGAMGGGISHGEYVLHLLTISRETP